MILTFLDVKSWLPCYWNSEACGFSDPDFNIAWYLLNEESLKIKNGLFALLAYLGQTLLGFFALLALGQILFHTLIFSGFEFLKTSKLHHLHIILDHRSRLHEFGLEQWNYALNNLYWLLSVALLIPLISRFSQPDPSKLNRGQLILQIMVPLFIISPMILTIIVRQVRLWDVWARLSGAPAEEFDLYHKQKIWPLDENWSSKLGLIVAFALLSYLIGTAPYDQFFTKLGF